MWSTKLIVKFKFFHLHEVQEHLVLLPCNRIFHHREFFSLSRRLCRHQIYGKSLVVGDLLNKQKIKSTPLLFLSKRKFPIILPVLGTFWHFSATTFPRNSANGTMTVCGGDKLNGFGKILIFDFKQTRKNWAYSFFIRTSSNTLSCNVFNFLTHSTNLTRSEIEKN